MKIKMRENVRPTLEMSSMTDLVFLLLIFFMLVTTMIVPNVNALKLVLPNSTTSQKQKDLTVSVAINENLQYFVGGQPVDLTNLRSVIEQKIGGEPNPTIILHTEYSVPISNVVTVMDIANKMKVKLVLATQPEK
jgi:biopolymer transport protein ExbD